LSDESLESDTDLAAIHRGAITVTPLHLDLTHGTTLRKLKKMLA
jgi:5'-nucleotidase